LPTPKYLKKRKRISTPERIVPLLVLAKMIEKVKIKDRKTKNKKRGTRPKELGSVKYTREAVSNHRNEVARRVGKKFLRSLVSFFLISFFM